MSAKKNVDFLSAFLKFKTGRSPITSTNLSFFSPDELLTWP